MSVGLRHFPAPCREQSLVHREADLRRPTASRSRSMSPALRLRPFGKKLILGCAAAALQAMLSGDAWAQSPTAEQALQLMPVQKDVEFDRPTKEEIAKCTIKVEKEGAVSGWVVFDPAGQTIRRFTDTNGDNTVDQWSYFSEGLEVYRDVDSNANGKADQFRWLNTGGTRWALDTNEDGKVDAWKMMSAEELSAEAIAAISMKDEARFARLLATSEELKSLGLGETQLKDLGEKVASAPKRFSGKLADVETVTRGSARWLNFSGTRPYTIPAGTGGSTKDITVYENIVTMFENDGKNGQFQIGTMIKVGDNWRLIDMPELLGADANQVAGGYFTDKARTLPAISERNPDGPGGSELATEVGKIDAKIPEAKTAEAVTALKKERIDLIESKLAKLDAGDKMQWTRQFIDSCSEAAESRTYPEAITRLKDFEKKLAADGADKDLVAYARFRGMTTDYMIAQSAPGTDPTKMQAAWLESLRAFVKDFPTSSEAPEALLQLAIDAEFSGKEQEAKELYTQIVTQFPSAHSATTAKGAVTRIDCVGKVLPLTGKTITGEKFDLTAYRGKTVLLHYWATNSPVALTDLAALKDIQAKYARENVVVVGISLDDKAETLAAYLKQSRLPWVNLHEEGGMQGRLASQMGILIVPTIMLVDKDGKVVHRGLHITEVDREVGTLVRK
ncbi:MAG: thioredoxin [Pirellula sp.]|nr:thioredoxin [Pirellula sp.]